MKLFKTLDFEDSYYPQKNLTIIFVGFCFPHIPISIISSIPSLNLSTLAGIFNMSCLFALLASEIFTTIEMVQSTLTTQGNSSQVSLSGNNRWRLSFLLSLIQGSAWSFLVEFSHFLQNSLALIMPSRALVSLKWYASYLVSSKVWGLCACICFLT